MPQQKNKKKLRVGKINVKCGICMIVCYKICMFLCKTTTKTNAKYNKPEGTKWNIEKSMYFTKEYREKKNMAVQRSTNNKSNKKIAHTTLTCTQTYRN